MWKTREKRQEAEGMADIEEAAASGNSRTERHVKKLRLRAQDTQGFKPAVGRGPGKGLLPLTKMVSAVDAC